MLVSVSQTLYVRFASVLSERLERVAFGAHSSKLVASLARSPSLDRVEDALLVATQARLTRPAHFGQELVTFVGRVQTLLLLQL